MSYHCSMAILWKITPSWSLWSWRIPLLGGQIFLTWISTMLIQILITNPWLWVKNIPYFTNLQIPEARPFWWIENLKKQPQTTRHFVRCGRHAAWERNSIRVKNKSAHRCALWAAGPGHRKIQRMQLQKLMTGGSIFLGNKKGETLLCSAHIKRSDRRIEVTSRSGHHSGK